ncbi:MAG: CHAD domain-containing protein, partial [Gammaproteobacteria bacterium]
LTDYDILLDQNRSPSGRQRLLRVGDAGRAFVKPQLKKVLKDGASITQESPPQALHDLRIEVKRLRYQIEHLGVPKRFIKRVGKSLVKLQVTLGRHQDAWVARDQLDSYRHKSELHLAESKTFKKLARLERDTAARLRNRFDKHWQAFEANAKRLKKALG